MSVGMVTELRCDVPDCGIVRQSDAMSFTEARREAGAQGWRTVGYRTRARPAGMSDLCPVHATDGGSWLQTGGTQ